VKIAILGGGPAGLYCGLLIKKAHPTHEVTIVERNPADATYGWGVVFSDRTLAAFQEADYPTYRAIIDNFVIWDEIATHYHGATIRAGGHVIAGIARKLLLGILRERCADLGVPVRFDTEIHDLSELSAADLVIGADGVNSLVRQTHAAVFRPRVENGRARYIWFGTDRAFDCFTFIFRESAHGLFQVHAYPFGGTTSTFIVECDEATWRRAGLDTAGEAESIAFCEALFADDLRGCRLFSNNSKWINFPTLKTATWHHGNVVLLGDAAHTAHFSIGSGTKLAMEDAIALANALEHRSGQGIGGLEAALGEYELDRRPVVETLQAAARESRDYFEHVSRYLHLAPEQFTFHLLTRSGRVSYDDLRVRDARYVDALDRWYAARHGPPPATAPALDGAAAPDDAPVGRDASVGHDASGRGDGKSAPGHHASDGANRVRPALALIAPPPVFAPLTVRASTLPNRVALACAADGSARDGLAGEGHRHQLRVRSGSGVALVLTEPLAVSADGRVTSGDAGLYRPDHVAAWTEFVREARALGSARFAAVLGHAGRRGAMRPRRDGLDRSLADGGWPLIAASAVPYTLATPTPRAMDRADMDHVRDAFERAARMADEAGFDMLVLHAGHGYLLGSFISPLTNLRADKYAGPIAHRLRFPLEVLAAARAAWPAAKPLAVAFSVTDCAPGGLAPDDAVAVAAAFAARGADLIHVLVGQTTPDAEPIYRRGFLTPFSDRVRNEARVATLVGGYITTTGEANTLLAAGRADLCLLDPPELTEGAGAIESAAAWESDALGERARRADGHAATAAQGKPAARKGARVHP
jgi:anthraniloyl-CoA monooxygenase